MIRGIGPHTSLTFTFRTLKITIGRRPCRSQAPMPNFPYVSRFFLHLNPHDQSHGSDVDVNRSIYNWQTRSPLMKGNRLSSKNTYIRMVQLAPICRNHQSPSPDLFLPRHAVRPPVVPYLPSCGFIRFCSPLRLQTVHFRNHRRLKMFHGAVSAVDLATANLAYLSHTVYVR